MAECSAGQRAEKTGDWKAGPMADHWVVPKAEQWAAHSADSRAELKAAWSGRTRAVYWAALTAGMKGMQKAVCLADHLAELTADLKVAC